MELYKDRDGINHRNWKAYQENLHDLAERLRNCSSLDGDCFLLEGAAVDKTRPHHPNREKDCDFLKNPSDNIDRTEKRICRCMYYYQKDKCVGCQFEHKMELQNSSRYEIKDYEVPMKFVMGQIGGIDLEIFDKKSGITYAAEVKPYWNTESLVRMIAEILTYTIDKVVDTYQPAICFFKNADSIQAKDFCKEEIQKNPDFQYLMQYVQVFYITYEQDGNVYKYTIHDNREEPLCR